MQKYICTSILIFCTGAALLGLNFVLEKMKTKNLQKEGLNFLQLTMYEFFQYLINIKQIVRNKCSIIDEFLCNKNIENIAEVFSLMAPPEMALNINVSSYAFTIKKEPMIVDLMLKLISNNRDIFKYINFVNQELTRWSKGDLNQILILLEQHRNKTFPKLIFTINMCIYATFKLMEIVAYYSPKRLVEFIDVDNIAGYIQEIENEIDAFLGYAHWKNAYRRAEIKKFSILKRIVFLVQNLYNYKKNKDCYIIVPEEEGFDLSPMTFDTAGDLISIMMTKCMAQKLMFYRKEDFTKKGFFVQDFDGSAKIIIGREAEPCLYRGQNFNHKQMLPGYLRPNIVNNEVMHCVEYIKREEFKLLFKQTPYYMLLRRLSVMGHFFEFDLDAVAQHYEFATNYLDVTKDVRVALFFAYTVCKDGKYYPVQDFNEYKPTLYIANQSLMHVINKNIVRPVGFQAVMRPLLQTAFALNMTSQNKDILSNFIEIELPQSPEVALAIYRSFNDGRDIFPDEPVMSLKNIVRERRELNEGLFKQYCREYKKPEAVLREKLEENFRITNTLPLIEPEMFTKMTSEVYDKLIPWIKENISYRKCRYADENNPNAYQDLFPKSLV